VSDGAKARKRALVVPREHGAWGILLVPLAVGAIVGLRAGGDASGLPSLCLATLALFWLRTPVESWLGASPVRARTPDELGLVRKASVALGAVAAVAVLWVFWGGGRWGLLWIGAASALAFLLQWAVKRTGRGGRAIAQMIGAAGLTATGPAAYHCTTARLDSLAWTIWTANFLFAGNQIHFVQLRIHPSRAVGQSFLLGQFALIAVLTAAYLSDVPGRNSVVAFVPVLFRGFAWFVRPPRPLEVHALGKSELAHALVFGALLAISA
jgi:YwiC-like protein